MTRWINICENTWLSRPRPLRGPALLNLFLQVPSGRPTPTLPGLSGEAMWLCRHQRAPSSPGWPQGGLERAQATERSHHSQVGLRRDDILVHRRTAALWEGARDHGPRGPLWESSAGIEERQPLGSFPDVVAQTQVGTYEVDVPGGDIVVHTVAGPVSRAAVAGPHGVVEHEAAAPHEQVQQEAQQLEAGGDEEEDECAGVLVRQQQLGEDAAQGDHHARRACEGRAVGLGPHAARPAPGAHTGAHPDRPARLGGCSLAPGSIYGVPAEDTARVTMWAPPSWGSVGRGGKQARKTPNTVRDGCPPREWPPWQGRAELCVPMFEEMKGQAAWTALLTLAHPGMEGRLGTSRCRRFKEQGPQVWGQATGGAAPGQRG